MGTVVSKCCFGLFELCNELFIVVAGGIPGLIALTYRGFQRQYFIRLAFVAAITLTNLVYVVHNAQTIENTKNNVVFITGCDSGLGYSLAQRTAELGFTVIAGCLDLQSKGALELQDAKFIRCKVDVTDLQSVKSAVAFVNDVLETQKQVLWALINNAGVMVFGEFEWSTNNLTKQQINVNLLGTLNLTKELCPLLRKHKGRVITITSHCALASLPGLSVYGATKAALRAWSDGLRVEMSKYGVKVITFVPGSFVYQSNIMARHTTNVTEMREGFTAEQVEFYSDYFNRYNSYLSGLSGERPLSKIDDPGLYETFERALMELNPRAHYINENVKYTVYHILFRFFPPFLRDYFVVKFMQMPEF